MAYFCNSIPTQNNKMAAAKLAINIFTFRKYTALYLSSVHLEAKFQWLTPISVVQQINGDIAHTVRCNRESVFQDGGDQTGWKPKVLISQLPDKIATPFQWLTPIFGVQQLNGAIHTVRCKQEVGF
jgi:hypothetical protein